MAGKSDNSASRLSAAKQALLRARLRSGTSSSQEVIPRRSQTEAPLSFAQQRLWFLDQFEPGSCAYNVARVFRLRGTLNTQALQQALDAIVRRHEVLRTTFALKNGEPIQRISIPAPVTPHLVDVSHLGREEKEGQARDIIAAEGTRPFRLSADPMLRPTLVKLDENEHMLVLITHHIVSDGWSKSVLFNELAAFYNAYVNDASPGLPHLSIQYSDFAAWQREWVNNRQLQRQLEYWKKQLAGAPPLLTLPTDFPRPVMQGSRGETIPWLLPVELMRALKSLSQREGTTLFMTLLATFQVLLSRYSRQEEIVVGTPIAGRTRPELEPLIGDFVNMLAIRTSVKDDPSFRELLKRVKETALQAYDNQDLPFEKLVEEIEQGRDMSRAPIFQTIFILETAPPPPPAMQGLQADTIEFDPPTAKNDLILILADGIDGGHVKLEYRTDLFTRATAEGLLRHFETLLRSVVADADQPVSALSILPPDEHGVILNQWNQTQVHGLANACIHQLFEAQCKHRPDAIALQFEDRQLSYKELNCRANQLAHYLRKLGVGPDARVGVCVHRSVEMMIALLGIMKAGGAYVPLDPSYPRERLAFMIDDAGAEILITQQSLRETFTQANRRIICIDEDEQNLSTENIDNPGAASSPSDLCYVIYTSGSTGRPKGVQLEHRHVVNFLNSARPLIGLNDSDVFLGVASMSFDASVLDFYLPLTTGAKLVIADSDIAKEPSRLAQLIESAGVTAMHATPSTWRSLLAAGWHGTPTMKILSGGEALTWDLAKRLLPSGSALWNFYGPTETAVYSAVHHVQKSDTTVLIGRPVPNTQIYILDPQLQPVPVGVHGEICIGGEGVARGYLNRPELNTEKFVSNPFQPGGRMYRTGDLGRFRPDGTMECLGRMDHQIKLRGFRIELGEIESVLEQFPGIREALAEIRASKSGDPRLVAYLVFDNEPLAAADIRRFLASKLPDYMIPAAFVSLDALPRSPNGKLDRGMLPEPGDVRPETVHPFAAPLTPLQISVAAIFSELLEVSQVSLHDNFFHLGGHSLLATRVVSRLRDRFRIDVSPRVLFESPTVQELSDRISSLMLQSASEDEMASALAELGELEIE